MYCLLRLAAIFAALFAMPLAAEHGLSIQPQKGYALGPSYACNGRLTATERAICLDMRLGELDRMMAQLYFGQRRKVSRTDWMILQQQQVLWLRWRDTCGSDNMCLQRRYEQRIIDLAPRDVLPLEFGCRPGDRDIQIRAEPLLPPREL